MTIQYANAGWAAAMVVCQQGGKKANINIQKSAEQRAFYMRCIDYLTQSAQAKQVSVDAVATVRGLFADVTPFTRNGHELLKDFRENGKPLVDWLFKVAADGTANKAQALLEDKDPKMPPEVFATVVALTLVRFLRYKEEGLPNTATWICRSCGTENTIDDDKCTFCGTDKNAQVIVPESIREINTFLEKALSLEGDAREMYLMKEVQRQFHVSLDRTMLFCTILEEEEGTDNYIGGLEARYREIYVQYTQLGAETFPKNYWLTGYLSELSRRHFLQKKQRKV